VRELVTPASLITSANLVAGFLALILAAQGELAWATGLIAVAATCDGIDGIVARRTHAECRFGSQLDSLADLVSFGAAPGLILYAGALHTIPVAGIGACLAYVVCGAWRLARFSVLADRRHFVGLPIPPAAITAVLMVASGAPPGLVLAVAAGLALAMISTLPFPTVSELVRLRRERAAART